MEHFDVLSNESIFKIVIYAMICCGILVSVFKYLGQRDAIDNYKKGIVIKVIPWVLLCVTLCEVGLLGYQLYQYPWSVEPQPSQASMFRQIRSMCEYPIWGFANDYQMPILSNLAGVVFWVCWTAYAFSFRPSATSWWKKALKVVAYVILSATILGFYVHEFKDFLVYGVILLVVFILLKVAHVRTTKKQKVQLFTKAIDNDADEDVSYSDVEEPYKEFQESIIPRVESQEMDSSEEDVSVNNDETKMTIKDNTFLTLKDIKTVGGQANDTSADSSFIVDLKQLPITKTEKWKFYAIAIYVVLLLLTLLSTELYVNNKKDKLRTELKNKVGKTFKDNTDNENTVEALWQNYPNELEYKEIQIPPIPKKNEEMKHWMNMFSGVEHVYKITKGGWTMSGMIYDMVKNNEDSLYSYGIQDYYYVPFLICVPYGVNFNAQIAKDIIEKSLEKVYCEPDKYNIIDNAKSYSNDYYHLVGQFNDDKKPEISIHFYSESTGTDPIYEKGKFTGYYWFGILHVGPYKIIKTYHNHVTWNTVEKEGFNASLRDRVLSYGIIFIILTCSLFLFIRKINIKIKKTKMILTESLKERLLRYANSLNFAKTSQSQKASLARDLSEIILNTKENDPKLIEVADVLKNGLDVNLITEQEKNYLIGVGSAFLKKNEKWRNQNIISAVNTLFALVADIADVDGKGYNEIQRTVSQLLDIQKLETTKS